MDSLHNDPLLKSTTVIEKYLLMLNERLSSLEDQIQGVEIQLQNINDYLCTPFVSVNFGTLGVKVELTDLVDFFNIVRNEYKIEILEVYLYNTENNDGFCKSGVIHLHVKHPRVLNFWKNRVDKSVRDAYKNRLYFWNWHQSCETDILNLPETNLNKLDLDTFVKCIV